jgi:hypothetical protein
VTRVPAESLIPPWLMSERSTLSYRILRAKIRFIFQAIVTGSTRPNLVEPAQQELAKAQNRFDDAEHGLRSVLSLGVELLVYYLRAWPSGASWLRAQSGSSVRAVPRQGARPGTGDAECGLCQATSETGPFAT